MAAVQVAPVHTPGVQVPPAELHALWSELLAAEARHYATFVELAVRAAGGDRALATARLERLSQLEGTIVAALADVGGASRATIHG